MSTDGDNGTAQVGQDERLAQYIKLYEGLKERGALREVQEREILLELIHLNQESINEYPMLEMQQRSIIEFMCRRVDDLPSHDFVREMMSQFLVTLNKYAKAKAVGNEAEAEVEKVEVFNQEHVILKCVQGVVYAKSLVNDNFEEVILKYYGEESLPAIDKIIENVEMNEQFWKSHVEHFVHNQVAEGYDYILGEEKFTIARQGSMLVVAFPFDEVLNRLQQSHKDISKTRVQKYFEEDGENPELPAIRQNALAFFQSKAGYVEDRPLPEESQWFLARVVGIDKAGERLLENARKLESGPDGEKPTLDEVEYVRQQVRALAAGAQLATTLVTRDFVQALGAFSAKDAAVIQNQIGNFEVGAFEAAFLYMLQTHFMHLLRERGHCWGNKIQVRLHQVRRVPQDAVAALEPMGMNRIRRNMLFEPDAASEGMLLFKQKSDKEFKEQLGVMGLEHELLEKLVPLWTGGPRKIEFLLVINLGLFAKTTQNLKAKLAEVFKSFGMGQRKETPPEAPPARGGGAEGSPAGDGARGTGE